MKKKLVAVLLTACLAMVVVAGCGSSSSKSTSAKTTKKNDSKTFVIGVDDTFPPMGFRNKDNKIVGFDIDLAREAAKRMNMKFKVQAINWDTKEMELNKNNIDAI
jgi:polar amino acid transport system substrate-binding protein